MKNKFAIIFVFVLLFCSSVSADFKSKVELDFYMAENTYELGKYPEAINLFNKIIPMTTDQNKIDSARIRIADSLYVLGREKDAVRIYKSVFMNGRYSMLKTIAFWKWRTTHQLSYYGFKEKAKIPNKFYNKYKVRLHNRLKRQSLEHPLSVSPVSQMNFLREISDLRYDPADGSSAIGEFRELYPEFARRMRRKY